MLGAHGVIPLDARKSQLQAAPREVEGIPPAVASKIQTTVDLARTHLTEARRSVGALRPNVGNGENIANALKRLADLSQRTTTVPIEVVVDELPRFGDGVEPTRNLNRLQAIS